MKAAMDDLQVMFEECGLKGRVVSIRRLQELKEEIAGRRSGGELDEALYQEGMSFFSFLAPDSLPAAESLIVMAMPRPQTRVSFTYRGKVHPLTFSSIADTARNAEKNLKDWLARKGYSAASARIPRKLLAVRSGIAQYGRNNIAYVAGMGSFFQILAFFSDLPCREDTWNEMRVMDRCRDCRACLSSCPTGAITAERFLIRAERCLTFHNEKPPEHAFPAWINREWHNSLVGCMLCQQCCPENREQLDKFDGNEEFSEEETAQILSGTTADRLSAAARAKLERLGLLEFMAVLTRNLGAILS
ncbi:MAG: 4Fe-4S double cluster binding domain-containing protein [Candidatus Wallbacteria bacterium]|nr:4Fe-4S double cluster binding domain-containing protein [Candidatus Wallbacteria bacterium]